MKVYTFVGYSSHLEELDFDYVVVDKTFNDLTPQLIDKFSNKIIWNETKSENRWLRIAKQLKKILEHIKSKNESAEQSSAQDENFAIIDSDLIIPDLRNIIPPNRIYTPCYWLYYDWANEIRPFCSGTNYIFNYNQIPYLELAINEYIELRQYEKIPVDIFIHSEIPHLNMLKIGTAHYVKTPSYVKKIPFTVFDLQNIFKHIPEFVEIKW